MRVPSRLIFKAFVALVAAVGPYCIASTVRAESNAAPSGVFLHDLADLPRGLALPLSRETRRVEMSPTTLRIRASASQATTTIDPLILGLPDAPASRASFVRRLSAPGRARELMRFVELRMTRPSPHERPRLRLDADAVALFDLKKLGRYLSREHQHVTLASAGLRRDAANRKALLAQVRPYLGQLAVEKLAAAIDRGAPLDVDTELLPQFASSRVGKYTSQRGPNCFRTALAFQDPQLPRSQEVNRNAERGFHSAMINNDELWWALTHRFVEVDTSRDVLRYGDVLVFFDDVDPTLPVSHRWLKHASTYLFGDYTFSKESYAADSPYTVKNLKDEWSAWQSRSKSFGVKVYRRR